MDENDWRLHLEHIAIVPARILLWILLVSFSLELVARELQLGGAFAYIPSLRNAGVILCLSWFLLRWKKAFHQALAARKIKGRPFLDPISLEMVGKLFTISIFFVSFLTILGLFGVDIAPLIAFGGIGAAALGFASRDVISNFFGGLMIYVTRPFTVHDQIELPEKKMQGTVEEIGWYLTSIRDAKKQPIYIPNALFSTQVLINLSRITHRRIDEIVRIRYADIGKSEAIIEEIKRLFAKHPQIDPHQVTDVHLVTLGDYALEIEIKAYTLATRYEQFMEIKQALLLEVHQIIERNGAQIQINLKHL